MTLEGEPRLGLDRQMDGHGRQGLNNPIGLAARGGDVSAGLRIIPDGVTAQSLRRANVPFDTVADDTDLGRSDAQSGEYPAEGSRFGFAYASLAFDLDMMEPRGQTEPLDLGTLQETIAVGQKRQPIAGLLQVREQSQGSGFAVHLVIAPHAEGVGQSLGDVGGRDTDAVSPQG